jgi:FkbM family methyltransferase
MNMHNFSNFLYKYFPFDKKWLSVLCNKLTLLVPRYFLNKKIVFNCDYGLKLLLPLKIAISWGVIFTGRIHPTETDILRNFFQHKPGNLMLLGGYRDGFLNLVVNDYILQNNKKSFIVEPVSEYYNNLIENLELNKSNNIECIKVAISDINGHERIYLDEGGTSFDSRTNKKFEDVEVYTFQNLLSKTKCKIDYLIVDIEKREFLVLDEASKIGINTIFFEVLHEERSQEVYDQIQNIVKQKKYFFYLIKRNRKLEEVLNFKHFKESELFNFILNKTKL